MPADVEGNISDAVTLERQSASTFRVGFVGISFIVLAVYLMVLAIYLIARITGSTALRAFVQLVHEAGATNVFGLPFAGGAAFGIVALFEQIATPQKKEGEVSFKIFGAQFSGPAGPTTLWIACFLTLLLGIKVAAGIDLEKTKAATRAVANKEASATR